MAKAEQFATDLKVILEGAPAGATEDGALRGDIVKSVLVESDVGQPSLCTIEVDNAERFFSHQTRLGDGVKVQFGRVGGEMGTVFEGEVTGLRPKYGSQGESTATIECFDFLHRLTRTRQSQTFEDRSEQEIIKKVVDGRLSVKCDIDETQPHVYQHNQTDFEFIMHRAAIHRARVYVRGKTLYFMTPDHERDKQSSIKLQLKPNVDHQLKTFSVRMSSAGVVNAVEVRGWDHTKKELITHRADPKGSSLGHGRLGDYLASDASSAFGNVVTYSVDSPSFDKTEAQSKAESLLYESMMNFITGYGIVVGKPDLKVGDVVEVQLYDKKLERDTQDRFDGYYYLEGVVHRYTREKSGDVGGYQVQVRVRRDAHGGGG